MTITVRAREPIVKGEKFRSIVPVIKPALDVLQAFLISIFCCFFATSAGFVEIELRDFLARGYGPEQQALLQMIGTLIDPLSANF